MALVFASPIDAPEPWLGALDRLLPDLECGIWPEVGDPARVEYALVYRPPAGMLRRFPRLRLILSLGAGVDGILADPELPDVPIIRMVEPSLTRTMTDYVLLAVLRVHRGLDHLARAQRDGAWSFALPALPETTRVGVLGLGEIGRAVAKRLHDNGFAVSGWSRTPRALATVRCHAGRDELPAMLAECDIVVSLLPATAATRDLMDASFFAAMKQGAHLVNVGRGDQVVDADLLLALDQGQLGGATLDVFREEPLPPDHPFWRHPNVLVTPHVAGCALPETGALAVAEAIRRDRAGEALLHVVDRSVGY
ncbi:MAG: glyoxylate/hydroxypyruvate reductase A [Geminicoccaceae bacterium]|nr:MAG: glyoxylate/hydroxypyruvate reductase A [Geminicoccaceae bacterium]